MLARPQRRCHSRFDGKPGKILRQRKNMLPGHNFPGAWTASGIPLFPDGLRGHFPSQAAQAGGDDVRQFGDVAAHHSLIAGAKKALTLLGRCGRWSPVEPMSDGLGQVGRKCPKRPRIAVAKGVNGIELAVVVGEPQGDGRGIQAGEEALALQLCEGFGERAGHIRRGPLGHGKARSAGLCHHADVFAQLAGPRVDIAKDAAVGFFEAGGVEWACDGMALQNTKGQKYPVRLKLIQFGLGAVIALVDQHVRTLVAVRIVGEPAQAIFETAGE